MSIDEHIVTSFIVMTSPFNSEARGHEIVNQGTWIAHNCANT